MSCCAMIGPATATVAVAVAIEAARLMYLLFFRRSKKRSQVKRSEGGEAVFGAEGVRYADDVDSCLMLCLVTGAKRCFGIRNAMLGRDDGSPNRLCFCGLVLELKEACFGVTAEMVRCVLASALRLAALGQIMVAIVQCKPL